MASTATINRWTEQLAESILPTTIVPERTRRRRFIDAFRKRVRHHTFVRTNQFDVNDRLNGLEEKFQILNRDDLSDALHDRRVELREQERPWLPDALDLLLRLSNDPIYKTKITVLHDHESWPPSPASPKETDLTADYPHDKDDPLWLQPQWSESSSDEDDAAQSPAHTSPSSIQPKPDTSGVIWPDVSFQPYVEKPATLNDASFRPLSTYLSKNGDAVVVVEEAQLIRETLLLLQGYPTTIFARNSKGFWALDKCITLRDIDSDVVSRALKPIYKVQNQLDFIRAWTCETTRVDYLQVIQQECDEIVTSYLSFVNKIACDMIKPQSKSTVSLLRTLEKLEWGSECRIIYSYIKTIRLNGSVECFEKLYDCLCRCYYCADDLGVATLMPIFVKACNIYMKPIMTWLKHGTLDPDAKWLFIRTMSDKSNLSALWTSEYELDLEEWCRPPSFLAPFARDIFTCGKTSAFIKMLSSEDHSNENTTTELADLLQKLETAASDFSLPFPPIFTSILDTLVSSTLTRQTSMLKHLLDTRCGLNQVLDAIDVVYLGKHGTANDNIESKIFRRIDRFQDNWNDRFLVTDILEDVYSNFRCIILESVVVRSIHTSSRSMRSRRRSAKIMSAIAVDYILPWPVANIISIQSMGVYRRIALHLAQIRRTRYVLERTAHPAAYSNPVSDNPADQKLAQALTFMLLNFTNTLYDHFTTAVTDCLTQKMRTELKEAQTIDDMIHSHRAYMSQLQYMCLLSKNLKVLRDALVGLLDMCIRFADLISSTSTRQTKRVLKSLRSRQRMSNNEKDRDSGSDADEDFETSSFVSADSQSWQKRRHMRHSRAEDRGTKRKSRYAQDDDDILPSSSSSASSSSDSEADIEYNETTRSKDHDDDGSSAGEGEGYSSFIVLEENTTVAKEIRKLQLQFQRQLDFFVAGLKAIGRAGVTPGDGSNAAGGEHINGNSHSGSNSIDEMNLLAARLTWRRNR